MSEHLFSDLRRATRVLLARPSFLLTSVTTLALGICALAAIFSVYDAVLLRPLPYQHAERIVDVSREQPPISHGPVSRQVFAEWRDRGADTFAAFGGYVQATRNLTGGGEAERLEAASVTPGFWQVFSHPIALGRAFDEQAETTNERVVVLSDALWRNRFASTADVVGRDIQLNGESFRVVGVAAPRFAFPRRTQVWVPTWLPSNSNGRGSNFVRVVAQLGDGIEPAVAAQVLSGIAAWEAKTWPDSHTGLAANVRPLRQSLVGKFDQPLAMLLLASALVLLIACANLASLMLARGQARAREFALRRALGADRRGLVRVVLAEAMVIAALGALIGLVAAQPAVHVLMSLAPSLLPVNATPQVDVRVVLVVVIAAVAALAFAGLAPAWRATRVNPADALRGGGRDVSGTQRQGRLRTLLVSGEIALALVLLAGSALLIQSLRHLGEVETGIASAQVLTARVAMPVPAHRPEEGQMDWFNRIKAVNCPRFDALLAQVKALPGVESAGLVDSLPVSGDGGSNGSFVLAGHPVPESEALVEHRFVSPDYFRTLGIPLRGGREFDRHDGGDAGFGGRVLVNQAFVDRYLPGQDAIGQQFSALIDDTPKTIVGVVGNARQFGLERAAQPETYFPARTYPQGELSIVVKVAGDAAALAEPLRRTLHEFAPDMPVFAVHTMDDATAQTTAMRRFNLTLMSVFAGVALALAAIGLYGVIAYAVGQRRREIGVRQALGADSAAIHRLMLASALRMIVPGLAIGLVGALVLGRLIASQLYGVGASDPLTLALAVIILALVALAACAIPTLRAARVPPLEALRDE